MEILQELEHIVITVTVLCCCSLLLACLKDKLERQIIVNTFGIQVIGLATLNISLNKMVFQILFDALLVFFSPSYGYNEIKSDLEERGFRISEPVNKYCSSLYT